LYRTRTEGGHSAIMDRMLNRRTFLKNSAASLPLAAAIQTLNPAAISAATIAVATISGAAPKLIPLPARLAPVDPSTLPWQQNIRRVGQSNMTEHDPAVMNIEEWADYWHSAGADIIFISVWPASSPSIPQGSSSTVTESFSLTVTSLVNVSPPPASALRPRPLCS